MIKRVLIVSAIVFIIALIIFWFVTGGWAAVARTAHSLSNPIEFFFGTSTSGSFLKLPWQPGELTRGPDISGYAGEADARLIAAGDEDQQSDTSSPVPTQKPANSSPYAGRVFISDETVTESDPAKEFIQITASENNPAPIVVTGWTLQSTVSGLHTAIPVAAPLFILGTINTAQSIRLAPGASVIITTALSPVGTSFRENTCSGYLSELYAFTPELSTGCPAPSEILPLNADNLRIYGSPCFDFLDSLPQCHFPSSVPSNLSSSCRSFISNTMSYNGCVNTFRNQPSFELPTFRAYAAFRSELWSNSHDVILLLDERGNVVDSLTY